MFSGKTSELLRRARRAVQMGRRVGLYVHALDDRYSTTHLTSHDGVRLAGRFVRDVPELRAHLAQEPCQVLAIDEIQFFEPEIVDLVLTAANNGLRVIVAGLDLDYRGQPFGPMPWLLAHAEFVTKLHAICSRTGGLAHFSHRRSPDARLILPGTEAQYEPLCRQAFLEALNEQESAETRLQ